MNNKAKSFTLIELLVVIAIIGILSGLIIVSMGGAVNSAKDARRKVDIENLSKSLLAWQADNNNSNNPASTTCILSGSGANCPTPVTQALKTILQTLPSDPESTNTQYTYQSNGGNDCIITAKLSDSSTYTYTCGGGFAKSSSGPTSSCPTVGGTWTDTGLGFCVQTYEAMNNGSNLPVSQSTTSFIPWRDNPGLFEGYCQALGCSGGTGCHLLTTDQETAISNNISSVAANWTGGSVNSGNQPRDGLPG